MKETLMRQIIAKHEELLNIYSDHVIAHELEGYDWNLSFRDPANKAIEELADLNEQLKQAEVESEVAEIKSTPIPSGWICPRCQKVHNWMVQSCDCYPSVITASTTEPIPENYLNDCIEKATPNLSKIKDVDKELAEIKGEDKRCPECGRDRVFYPNGKMNWHCRCGFAFE